MEIGITMEAIDKMISDFEEVRSENIQETSAPQETPAPIENPEEEEEEY